MAFVEQSRVPLTSRGGHEDQFNPLELSPKPYGASAIKNDANGFRITGLHKSGKFNKTSFDL